MGDVVKGTADLFRLGNGSYDAYQQYKKGDYLGALSSASQDGGRLGGILLLASGPKAATELKANRLLRDIEAERARGGYGLRRTYQGSVEPRTAKVVTRAGEKFVGRDSRTISKTSGSVSKLNDRVYRGPTTKQGGHIHAGQRVANFTYKGKGVKIKANGNTSTHELANIHVPLK